MNKNGERARILSAVDANSDKAIALLREMVTIPSVTGDEGRIQHYLNDVLSGMGLAVDTWETDWNELKKHPGYRTVERGYEGRPNIVARLAGK